MNPHYSANIAGKIAPTCRDGEIFGRVKSVGIDHEVAIVLINPWCLAPIPAVEEFRDTFHFR